MILLNNEENPTKCNEQVFIKSFRTQKMKVKWLTLISLTNSLDHSMSKYFKAEQLQLWQQ